MKQLDIVAKLQESIQVNIKKENEVDGRGREASKVAFLDISYVYGEEEIGSLEETGRAIIIVGFIKYFENMPA